MNKSGDIDEGRNRNVQRKGNHENEVKPCQEQNGKMASQARLFSDLEVVTP